MKVRIGTRLLALVFPYELLKPSRENPNEVRAVYCELHRIDAQGKTEAVLARTRARCSVKDNFSFEKGRKTALARALKNYGMVKQDRAIVWEAYLNRPRPKSVQPPVKIQPRESQSIEEAISNIVSNIVEFNPQQADGYREPTIHTLDFNAGEGVH